MTNPLFRVPVEILTVRWQRQTRRYALTKAHGSRDTTPTRTRCGRKIPAGATVGRLWLDPHEPAFCQRCFQAR